MCSYIKANLNSLDHCIGAFPTEQVNMDRLIKLYEHPAYKLNKHNIANAKLFMDISEALSQMEKLVAMHRLSVESRIPLGESHYVQCWKSWNVRNSNYDQCGGRCLCRELEYQYDKVKANLDNLY